ncbi:MAG: RNA polymerase sigma factor [Dysgonamonadaceae bacterium]|jgi:RNA polymerase sigma-70 factor (ECF subfamily)|nr:RNA polymerase sigma factor [Dysgonamonadaceae bacterium]
MELETFVIHVVPLREKLQNFSQKLIENDADAEDVVQEIFLRLWSMRSTLSKYDSVEALAMQMTKNLSLDKLKSRKASGNEFEMLNLACTTRTPAEELEEQNSVEYIRQLVNQLPYLQQTIMRMKDIEGYELAEIAEITGSQIEAVRTNLSRARKKIREQCLNLDF